MKQKLITEAYYRLMPRRLSNKQDIMRLHDFKVYIEIEELTKNELEDLEYLDDRVDVWIDNNEGLKVEI